jgi:hypothetical protein
MGHARSSVAVRERPVGGDGSNRSGPARDLAIATKGRTRMASGMETPIERLEIGSVRELAAPHEDPMSEIGRWVVLGAGVTLGQRWGGDVRPHSSRAMERIAHPKSGMPLLAPGVTTVGDDGDTPAICDVIATWRAADRRLAGLAMNSPERDRVHAELVGLRALHHRLFDARMAERPTGGGRVDRSSFSLMAWARGPRPAIVIG